MRRQWRRSTACLCVVVSSASAFTNQGARLPSALCAALTSSTSMAARRDTRDEGMAGTLFQYKSQLQAFESGPASAQRKLVVLGGLSDGMLACPYVPQLSSALAAEGWSVVQPNLRSSYMQWGFGSLTEDVDDLTALLDFLVSRRGAHQLAICGHSTGAQVIAHLMRTRPHLAVSHVIMQGGVSDRETDDADAASKKRELLKLAQEISVSSPAGGSEMMPRNTTWAPITAQRYQDLNAFAGADDYFSSDLDDSHFRDRFGGFYTRTSALIAYSAADEYVPKSVDKGALLRRLCAAMKSPGAGESGAGGASGGETPVVAAVLIEGADHALYSEQAADQFVSAVGAFLNGRPVPDTICWSLENAPPPNTIVG